MSLKKHSIQIFAVLFCYLFFTTSGNVWGNDSEEEKKVIEKPTLENLYAGWWAYIEEKPEESSARLLSLVDEKSLAIKSEKTKLYLKQINNRIGGWDKLIQEELSPAENKTYPDDYSLNNLLEVVAELRTAKRQLNSDEQLIRDREKAYKNSNVLLDRLTAQYIQIKKDNTARPEAALEIISQKLKSEILHEDIRLLKAKLIQSENNIQNIEKHFEKTQTKISIESTLQELEKNADLANNELKSARNNLLNNELKYDYTNTENTNEIEANAILLSSKVTVLEKELAAIFSSIALDAKQMLASKKNNQAIKAASNTVYENAKKRQSQFNDMNDDLKILNREGRQLFEKNMDSTGNSAPTNSEFENIQTALSTLATLDDQQQDYAIINNVLIEQSSNSSAVTRGILFSAKEAWNNSMGIMGYSLFKIGDTPVTALSLIRLLLIIFIGLKLAKALSKLVIKVGNKNGRASSGIYTISRLVQYVIISASIILGLSSIGIDFTKLAFLAGALSIGIGFGLQSIVNNFVSGLILLFERSLRVGDIIQLANGHIGRVKEINVRSTLVNTADNVDLIVPNAELLNNQLVNLTLKEQYTRMHVPFGVAYGTNKELVKEAALAAAEQVDFVMKNNPIDVWLVNFGDSSLDFELVVWVNMNKVKVAGSAKPVFLWYIETELAKRNIEIPFPQRDLHVRSVSDGVVFKS